MRSLVGYDWPQGRSKQVAYVSQDHHIHELSVGSGGNWQHNDLTLQVGAPPAVSRFIAGYPWPEGNSKQVTFLGPDGQIHEIWTINGNTWQHSNLSALTGSPPAQQITAGYSWSEGRSKQIVFIGDDGHIHELNCSLGERWRHLDLTALTDSPLPGSQYMVGYNWSQGRSKQISYVGQDGHIHELSQVAGQQWNYADLTNLTRAPRATELVAGFEWPEGRSKQLVFINEDRHLHELYVVAGNSWAHADLHQITNAPSSTTIASGYAWSGGRSKQVAFVSQDFRIHELSVELGGNWRHIDLSSRANAPITSITAVVGYAWESGNVKQVAYTGEDGQIRELWQPQVGNWTYSDLSRIVSALPARF